MNISIKGLSKPAVLAALFNASKQQGLGFMDERGAKPMSETDAAEVIESHGLNFDYLRGRVMKIGIDGETVDTRLFDRDNGQGAAERAINAVPVDLGAA